MIQRALSVAAIASPAGFLISPSLMPSAVRMVVRATIKMKITASRTSLGEIREDVLIVPVFEGETPRDSEDASALAALDHLTRGAVTSVFDDGEMTGKRDRWVLLREAGPFSTKRLLFYGAGSAEKIDSLSVQRLAGAAALRS